MLFVSLVVTPVPLILFYSFEIDGVAMLFSPSQ